jgi:small multidrug resistance family-3 protein
LALGLITSTTALAKGKVGRMAYSRAGVPDFAHVEFSAVPNAMQNMPAVALLLLAATILEASGDAVVRVAIYNHAGTVRLGLFVAGAALLFGYGTLLNLAPVQFGQVVGLYLATLFVVWQIINFVAFRALPTLPIILGGSLIIAGGAVITFWNPALAD